MPPRICSLIAYVRAGQHEDEDTTRPASRPARAILATWRSCAGEHSGSDVFAIDVAREEIGAGDGHDGGGHQRADDDGGERHAHEPRRETSAGTARAPRNWGRTVLKPARIFRHRFHADWRPPCSPAARSTRARRNRREGSRRCAARHAGSTSSTIPSPHADRETAPAPNPAPASHSRTCAEIVRRRRARAEALPAARSRRSCA